MEGKNFRTACPSLQGVQASTRKGGRYVGAVGRWWSRWTKSAEFTAELPADLGLTVNDPGPTTSAVRPSAAPGRGGRQRENVLAPDERGRHASQESVNSPRRVRLVGLKEFESRERLRWEEEQESALQTIDIEQPDARSARVAWEMPTAGLEPVELLGSSRLPVVGESQYQEALRAAVGGRASRNGYEDAIPVTALLVPDPRNPYDSNAVRVEVEGHLPRENALDYQPHLMRLLERGQVGQCSAGVCGGGHKLYGIFLRVGPPSLLVPANRRPPTMTLLEADRLVTVTGEKDHQLALSRYEPGDDSRVPLIAELRMGITRQVDVALDCEKVGSLTKYQSERYRSLIEPILASGGRVGAEAYMHRKGEAWEIELLMPQIDR
jgi:hypothetical protein